MRLLCCAIALAACDGPKSGGITADLVFERTGSRTSALSIETDGRGLSPAAVPMIIDRLQITALEADGSTIAETNLYGSPSGDQLRLEYEGGDWSLDGIPAGDGRSVVAKALLGTNVDPRVAGVVAFRGRTDGISVSPGEIENVGTIVLISTGLKIPEIDLEPPAAPNPVTPSPLEAGNTLRVTFGQPAGADGYVVVVASSTIGQMPPILERQRELVVGEDLVPGATVHTIWPFAGPMITDITGLTDGVPYAILVYAYDTDLDARPLNYSSPGVGFGIPADRLPPDPITDLVIGSSGGFSAAISFIAPTEDRGVAASGPVSSYEVRASEDRDQLTNPSVFPSLPMVTPPPGGDRPGDRVSFVRTFAQLSVQSDQPFFVGIRAIDAAENVGEITVAEFAENSTAALVLDRVDPTIGVAGQEITLVGANFGISPGVVSLTTTGTSVEVIRCPVSRWEDGIVVAGLPRFGRTGTLMLQRVVDSAAVTQFLPVILRLDDVVQDYEPPFEMIGSSPDGARVVSAVYREDGEFFPVEAAVERIVGFVGEQIPFAPFTQDDHATTVAGTYSPIYDRFLFVVSNDPMKMDSIFVTSSTLTPDPIRFVSSVAAGDADRVSVVFLDGGIGGRYPALLAFTFNGAIRTATVADAMIEPFNQFYAVTSTFAAFDRVTIQRNDVGDVLMAHRTVTAMRTDLSLRLNTQNGSPDGFPPRVVASPPEVGTGFEIVSLPRFAGGPETFVVAYDSVENGRTEVRLLRIDDYGQSLGYAPFPAIGESRRLEDVGVVIREGRIWLALLASTINGAAELFYTEVPFGALDGSVPDGSHPGVRLDLAPGNTRGRLGCKPLPQLNCPMIWSGDNANVFFLRR